MDIEGNEFEAVKCCTRQARVDRRSASSIHVTGRPAGAFVASPLGFDLLSGGRDERASFVVRQRSVA